MATELANIFGFGNPWDIAIIAGVVVLLFGGAKVAGFGRQLGEGMKEFKKAAREAGSDEPADTPEDHLVSQPEAAANEEAATKEKSS